MFQCRWHAYKEKGSNKAIDTDVQILDFTVSNPETESVVRSSLLYQVCAVFYEDRDMADIRPLLKDTLAAPPLR